MNPFFEKINNNTIALVGLIVFIVAGMMFEIYETLIGTALGGLIMFLKSE